MSDAAGSTDLGKTSTGMQPNVATPLAWYKLPVVGDIAAKQSGLPS